MNVLFLLSCLEPSGSETYCLSLARTWEGRHDIFWISDRLHYGQTYHSLPISGKAIPEGVLNTGRVITFIRRHKIDLIHSHSRRAHWVAAQAAYWSGIPHVTTVHQPPPVHFFSKLFPCLGDQTIAIDEAVAESLVKHFRRSTKNIHLIRNGIELDRFKATGPASKGPKRILFLGRLSGGRWKAFQFFLEVLGRAGKSLPAAHYQIAGRVSDERAPDTAQQVAALNLRIAPSRIEMLGWTEELPALIRASDGVIAGGRSAMESLASGKPVLLMGEGGVIGLASQNTWPEALRTNLGDHLSPPRFYHAPMELALRELLTANAEQGEWGREQVEKYYDIVAVARDVDSVYQCLTSQS